MSIREHLTRDELFVWRDERSDAAERRADRAERFHEATESDLADMNEIERLRNAVEFYKLAFFKGPRGSWHKPRLVPAKIRLSVRIAGDGPFADTIAGPGEFDCECNQYGAISVRAENGKLLGVKLHECDILEWKENDKA